MNKFSVEKYLDDLNLSVRNYESEVFIEVLKKIEQCYIHSGTVYLGGNGGSATIIEHIITDWNKGIFEHTNKSLRAISLVGNLGIVTATANDEGWENVFAKQIDYFTKGTQSLKNDLAIFISSSGNSQNVLNAVKFCKSIGIFTIGLSGFGDSKLFREADLSLSFKTFNMQIIEDSHARFGHLVLHYISSKFNGSQEISLGEK
jgi:phosphoheptose isomerase